ncbi:NAD(P)H-dependent glycerol-3-phosphate dehydrogenase [Lysinibacter sp. HNR]|uniref:NAD(P)H-dependent glycerol-3-phosphate dehydrogenase n=1 Tax=Lysinibacter sp. HNR TaxID=3031408 RepID=UPI0024359A63|nr:NAD(P)H-dependent glycerol-3-phosphate dehydrogenase [Lysinibacter sp. HNR]WGD38391.1 NAD(P)-dependent glycerol-3-phosphate dehydrogenase [Lysinibacter sp. HNR]
MKVEAPGVSRNTRRRRVAVVGAGSWGTSFAKILGDAGCDVVMWARRPEVAQEISIAKRNSSYLPGINLPLSVNATSSLAESVEEANLVFLAVPSQKLRENLRLLEPALAGDAALVSLVKGVEKGTNLRMSQVIEETLDIDPDRIAVVSGPNLALELAQEQPTAAVASSRSLPLAQAVAMASAAPYFKTFVNVDVVGTEFGGVLKNLIALAIGIVDGVGHGENTKASIITRGLVEMTDFAVAFGAEPTTLQGLAGLGDLIATCQSPLSRNNTAGRLLGQGFSLDDVVKQMSQTAEGISSVAPILALAHSRGVEMPIVEQVSRVINGTLSPDRLAPHLTTKDGIPTPESPEAIAPSHTGRWKKLVRSLKGNR